MTWVAAAVITSAVVSAGVGADAASKASYAQRKAAADATAAEKEAADKQMQLQEPFRQAGMLGQNRLMTLLGLRGQAQPGPDMGIMGGPAGAIPTGAQNAMIGGDVNSADFGKYARDFGMADYQADPGYAFRLSEGMKALDRTAAARGGLLSGATLKGAQRYGQDMASQEYQNAFNRYQVNRANQLNPLQSLAGQAQSAAGVMGNAAQSFGQQAGENYIGAGNARASGYVGQANALNSALGQGFNQYMGSQYMNNMAPAQYAGFNFTPGAGGGYTNAQPWTVGPQMPAAM